MVKYKFLKNKVTVSQNLDSSTASLKLSLWKFNLNAVWQTDITNVQESVRLW